MFGSCRRGVGLCRTRADESALAPSGFDNPVVLQFKVDPGDGVGIDATVDRQLPDRREAIAWPQFTTRDRQPNLQRQLRMQGHRAISVNLNHGRTAFVLVH